MNILNIIKTSLILLLLFLSPVAKAQFAVADPQVVEQVKQMYVDKKQLKEWMKAAQSGDFQSQGILMGIYYNGTANIPQDIREAAKWLKKMVETGLKSGDASFVPAYCGLLMEYRDKFTNMDVDTEIQTMLGRGLLTNNALCYTTMGTFQEEKGRRTEAKKYYAHAANMGESLALSKMAEYEFDGNNYPEAFEYAKKAAEMGNPGAMDILCILYHHGQGTPIDYDKAAEWGEKAIRNGMGNCAGYFVDACLKSDSYSTQKKGFDLIQENLYNASGDVDANNGYVLATFYENGKGTPQDKNRAFSLYRQSAEKGHTDSKIKVAESYLYGENGQPADEQKALAILDELSEAGNIDAILTKYTYWFGKEDGKKCIEIMDWIDKHGLTKNLYEDKKGYYRDMANLYGGKQYSVYDPMKAREYLEKIPEDFSDPTYHLAQGDLLSQKQYGCINYEKSVAHYRKVLELTQDPSARYQAYLALSKAYRFGRGVEKDELKADEMLHNAEKYDGQAFDGRRDYVKMSDILKNKEND